VPSEVGTDSFGQQRGVTPTEFIDVTRLQRHPRRPLATSRTMYGERGKRSRVIGGQYSAMSWRDLVSTTNYIQPAAGGNMMYLPVPTYVPFLGPLSAYRSIQHREVIPPRAGQGLAQQPRAVLPYAAH